MNDPIGFSPEELLVIQDTRFFHIKAALTPKIQEILHQLHDLYQKELPRAELLMPNGVNIQSGQFVKGEHLLDFPYLYLDFPKFFTQQEKFSFRTLFWWGHYWVFAWILEGRYLEHYKKNIIDRYESLSDQGLFLQMADTPWEWRKENNFVLEIRKDNQKKVADSLKTRPFLKIHRYMDFERAGKDKGNIIREAVDIFRLMQVIVEK